MKKFLKYGFLFLIIFILTFWIGSFTQKSYEGIRLAIETRISRLKTPDVPSWSHDVVWYQIFPERFRNGDVQNDPTVNDLEKSDIPGWEIRPWGSDWYEMAEWERKTFGHVFRSIRHRRYGGDLQGILDKLDYLQGLGVTALYLNPVFSSPSLHKYNARSFHHVDENFGPDPEGDRKLIVQAHETEDPQTWVWTSADKLFLKLIREVHRRHMKIILDGAFNHSGRDFFAFQDILQKGKSSQYSKWYKITQWDPQTKDGFFYQGWIGHDSLPEFRRDSKGLDPDVEKYIFNIAERWMAPSGRAEDGIDGWRLDVAYCVPDVFWKKWRKKVKQINPEAYLVGEVIGIEPRYLWGDQFDALMNYPFLGVVGKFFIVPQKSGPVTWFDRELEKIREAYPPRTVGAMQNLVDSHDTARIRSQIVNPKFYQQSWANFYRTSQSETNPDYRVDRGEERDQRIQKLIVVFQMTYPGSPMIYYGDEAGMNGTNDPDCRKPMLWEDLDYEDEAVHPYWRYVRPREPNRIDRDLFNHYRKLIHIRNGSLALRRGDFETVYIDDLKNVYGFSRRYEKERVIVFLNNSDRIQKISWKLQNPRVTFFEDLLRGKKIAGAEGELSLELPPKEAFVLKEIS